MPATDPRDPVGTVPSAQVVASAQVVVVGDGAAGTLVALHLLRRWRTGGHPAGGGAVVALVGTGDTGRGVAYGTDDPRHLLNVPASGMSALPDDPEHLLRWARARDERVGPGTYLPRGRYGSYLAETLEQEAAAPGAVGRLLRVANRAVRVAPAPGGRTRVHLDDGGAVDGDDVVLALGVQAPGAAWAPAGLGEDPALVEDPWAPGALARLDGDRVLLVGTGLTMVDAALTLGRPGRTLHAVSRHGLLPRVHASRPVVPAAFVLPDDVELDTPTLVAAVEDQVARTVRAGGDWRGVVDGVRTRAAESWQRLCGHCRAELLAHHVRRWEVLRHRMPRASATAIAAARASGALTVRAAGVADAVRTPEGLRVGLSDGTAVVVDHVVSCTGPLLDPARSHDPLLRALLDDGLAVPGPLALGLATDPDGRVLDRDGHGRRLWTLGALRRGEVWETTAVPEIRVQARDLALALAGPAPARGEGRGAAVGRGS